MVNFPDIGNFIETRSSIFPQSRRDPGQRVNRWAAGPALDPADIGLTDAVFPPALSASYCTRGGQRSPPESLRTQPAWPHIPPRIPGHSTVHSDTNDFIIDHEKIEYPCNIAGKLDAQLK